MEPSGPELLPASAERVAKSSRTAANRRIRENMTAELRRCAAMGVGEIHEQIKRLRREWDMERTLEMNASIACGTGLLLGWLVNPRWFLFSAGVMAFLLQHALQGWCPPMPVFRWLGWRTAYEITDMVVALHVLAGDLDFIKAAGAGRQELAERMAANMASRGYFVGGSALRGGNKGGVSTGRQTPGAAALTSKQE